MSAWIASVSKGDEPLPDRWLKERPDLLWRWPIHGGHDPHVGRGDLLLYYAPGHQRLIAVGRTSGDFQSSEAVVPVQVLLAIPTINLSPICDWEALGLTPHALGGHMAVRLTDAGYAAGWEAIVQRRGRPSRGCHLR